MQNILVARIIGLDAVERCHESIDARRTVVHQNAEHDGLTAGEVKTGGGSAPPKSASLSPLTSSRWVSFSAASGWARFPFHHAALQSPARAHASAAPFPQRDAAAALDGGKNLPAPRVDRLAADRRHQVEGRMLPSGGRVQEKRSDGQDVMHRDGRPLGGHQRRQHATAFFSP
jgi:hypothetical protein